MSVIKKALELYYTDQGHYPIPSTACPDMQNSGAFGCGFYDTRPDETSWLTFENELKPYISKLPKESKKSYAPAWVNGGYAYSYYSGYSSCGITPGTAYILYYRLDTSQSLITDANCPDLVAAHASNASSGASYYMSPRH